MLAHKSESGPFYIQHHTTCSDPGALTARPSKATRIDTEPIAAGSEPTAIVSLADGAVHY